MKIKELLESYDDINPKDSYDLFMEYQENILELISKDRGLKSSQISYEWTIIAEQYLIQAQKLIDFIKPLLHTTIMILISGNSNWSKDKYAIFLINRAERELEKDGEVDRISYQQNTTKHYHTRILKHCR